MKYDFSDDVVNLHIVTAKKDCEGNIIRVAIAGYTDRTPELRAFADGVYLCDFYGEWVNTCTEVHCEVIEAIIIEWIKAQETI